MAVYTSGTIINNRYEVVQGPKEKPSLAGGMGLVYLCVDHAEDGKPVALKTFRPELLSNRAARDRFLREGTTWVELGKHPHIVRCYEVFKVDVGSEVFFALELVAAAEGKSDASLRSWLIPNELLPLEQALLFALHICRGMAHATTKIPGMVHRDLKPENILIGRDGRARMTDFGLASAAQNLGSDWQTDEDTSSSHVRTQLTHGIAGTPLYMAPEQWAGEPLDERTDIYAFGCILYEMLCGSFIVTGRTREELKKAHCQGSLRDIPPEFPKKLSILLQRCLALNRADRFPNWVELEKNMSKVYYLMINENAPELMEEVEDTRTERIAVGHSYNAIGRSYMDIGKNDIARKYFERVLIITQTYNDLYLEEVVLINLGSASLQLGEPIRAIEFYEKALAIIREIGDVYSQGCTLGNLGLAYKRLGDPHRAINYYEQYLSIAREIGDRKGEGTALGYLSNVYESLGDLRKSIDFNESRLKIVQMIGDRYGEGQTLCNLANVFRELKDFYSSIRLYEQSLAIAREIGNRQDEGNALGGLGNVYADLGDIHRAIEYYEQHLAIAREIGDLYSEVIALGNLGIAYSELGENPRAIDFYEQSLKITREIGDMHGAAILSINLARLLSKDQPNEAIKYAENASQVFTKMGNIPDVVRAQALIYKILNSS